MADTALCNDLCFIEHGTLTVLWEWDYGSVTTLSLSFTIDLHHHRGVNPRGRRSTKRNPEPVYNVKNVLSSYLEKCLALKILFNMTEST